MDLLALLRNWMESRTIIGVSPWRDGEGLLFGRIILMDDESITLEKIDPYGQLDDVSTIRLDSVSYFDLDEPYAERLTKLGSFKGTKPEDGDFTADFLPMLENARQSGDPVRIRLLGEETACRVTILELCDTWVKYAVHDDLMNTLTVEIRRLDAIVSVRSGTRKEEADAFLLGLLRDTSENQTKPDGNAPS